MTTPDDLVKALAKVDARLARVRAAARQATLRGPGSDLDADLEAAEDAYDLLGYVVTALKDVNPPD